MTPCRGCGQEVGPDLERCPRCDTLLVDPLLGAVLGDRYRILARIGAGGMGAVYRALHTALKREVAVKVLLPDFGGKDEFVRRFVREAESASRLAHPNIVAVTDFGKTAEGLLFLVMELLDGVSLTSVIRQGAVPPSRALPILYQVLAGLGHAHAGGIIHRDLKPDNIMLVVRDGKPDVVKLLDFGIAKVTDPAGGEVLTQAGVIFGTPEYLSPEQALGDQVDARADLYAVGVIAFEMLTGRRPFESDEKVRIISMHLSHAVPRMADRNPAAAIPAPVEEAVLQALAKNREHRFASAQAFSAALEDAAQDATVARVSVPHHPAPPGSAATASGPNRWRSRALLAAGLAAVILVAAVTIVSVGRRGSSGRPVATAAVPPSPAPATGELAGRIHGVEALLAAGDVVKARVALDQVLAENPRNGRVRYLLGRLAFAENRRSEALGSYREAIVLDAGFRGDPILIEHLGVALTDARIADAALDLAIERVGRPAVELLQKVANGTGDVGRRRRAANALVDLGETARVDHVALQIAELKKLGPCEGRKPLVVALGDSGDLRALPALRAQRSRGGIEGLFGGAPDTSCMKVELGEAIAQLEEKLPVEKRPASATSTQRPGSRSLFRGR
jgi:eukaryotic-like serine/threonine-protein kinase